MFQFRLGEGGEFSFSVDSGMWYEGDADANLDVLAKLYRDNTQTALYEWNTTDMGLLEEITLFDLDEGTYFLSLEGTELAGIYSGYASIGSYIFEGWFREGTFGPSNPSQVPEPATLMLLGLGLAGLGLVSRRKK